MTLTPTQRNLRHTLLRQFGETIGGQLRNPLLCGDTPFRTYPLRDGLLQWQVAGYRTAQLYMNLGLHTERFVKAATPERLVHFVPWADDLGETLPHAYVSGKYTVIEAAWPTPLQIAAVQLGDIGNCPRDGKHFIFGPDQFGSTVTVPHTDIKHMLIGGTTGSGKSWLMRLLAVQAAVWANQTHAVNNLVMLLDGKGGDAFQLLDRKLPGQILPLALTEGEWETALLWLLQEMEQRYALKRAWGGKNLNFGAPLDAARHTLPRIIVLADEFQTFTEHRANPVITDAMNQLATKGRAAGIMLIAGTQKPTVTMFGRQGNAHRGMYTTVVCLKTATESDSRLLWRDEAGARLLGAGDALLATPSGDLEKRLQLAYVPEAQLEALPDVAPLLEYEALPEVTPAGLTPFSSCQIAAALYAAQRNWGRPNLQKLCQHLGAPVTNSDAARALRDLGRDAFACYSDILEAPPDLAAMPD